MTSYWPRRALWTLLLLPLLACFSPNEEFCESDDQCGETQRCDRDKQSCEPIPAQAAEPDAGTVEPEITDSCGKSCVAAAPTDWQGPVAKTNAAAGEEPSACDDTFSVDLGLGSAEIISEGSCECNCGNASGLSCTPGFIREWKSSESSCELQQCDIVGGSCFESTQTLLFRTCMEISFVMRDFPILHATFGNLTSGSCGQPTASGELSSRLGSQTRLCKIPSLSKDCGEDGICSPTLPEGFADELCIVRDGEHSCPLLGGYSERTLLFTGVDDQRSCDADSCTCSSPTGSCGGEVTLYDGGVNNDACAGTLATLKGSNGLFGNANLCQATPASASMVRYDADLSARSCTKGGSAGVAGQAVGTNARTLCCQPQS